MEEQNRVIKNPNYIQLDNGFLRGLFWDYFCYIDSKNYTIDDILIRHEIPVTFANTEFHKKDSDYVFCFLRCRKKYTPTLLDKVFPQLHQANIRKNKEEYLKECGDAINAVLYYMDTQQKETL